MKRNEMICWTLFFLSENFSVFGGDGGVCFDDSYENSNIDADDNDRLQ